MSNLPRLGYAGLRVRKARAHGDAPEQLLGGALALAFRPGVLRERRRRPSKHRSDDDNSMQLHASVPVVPVEHLASPAGRASTTGREAAAPTRPVWCKPLLDGALFVHIHPFTYSLRPTAVEVRRILLVGEVNKRVEAKPKTSIYLEYPGIVVELVA